jgi:hypothetical protein
MPVCASPTPFLPCCRCAPQTHCRVGTVAAASTRSCNYGLILGLNLALCYVFGAAGADSRA